MPDIGFHGFEKDVYNHNCASVVALTVALCEWVSNLGPEVRYIWLSSWGNAKWTYIFTRYCAIAYLITNLVLSAVWQSSLPIHESKCMVWYLQSMICFCLLYVASILILSKRVLAAYKVRNVGFALLVFHVAELAGSVSSGKDTLSAVTFNGVCDTFGVPKQVSLFIGLLILGQVVMWTLILGGFQRGDSPGSPRFTLQQMLSRAWHDADAKMAWILCCMLFAVNAHRGTNDKSVKPAFLFAWPISILSSGTCRYILNMERTAPAQVKRSQPQPHCDDYEAQADHGSDDTADCNVLGPHTLHHTVHAMSAPALHAVDTASPDDFQTLSLETMNWDHPFSLLRSVSNSTITTHERCSELSIGSTNGSTWRSSASSKGSFTSSTRRLSSSNRASFETEITVPSIGGRSSIDIEVGSLHSSSTASSGELRDFWNEVWSGDERTFRHP